MWWDERSRAEGRLTSLLEVESVYAVRLMSNNLNRCVLNKIPKDLEFEFHWEIEQFDSRSGLLLELELSEPCVLSGLEA